MLLYAREAAPPWTTALVWCRLGRLVLPSAGNSTAPDDHHKPREEGMKATCPHCQKDIDVVSSGDLEREFGLNQNRQQHMRDQGKMPKPWLEYPNRNVY